MFKDNEKEEHGAYRTAVHHTTTIFDYFFAIQAIGVKLLLEKRSRNRWSSRSSFLQEE